MITRRQFIGAAGLMTVAATAPAFAYESRWPKKPSVPTDLNAEEFFTELAEKGSGFVVGNEKADTVVMMTFDTQCRWWGPPFWPQRIRRLCSSSTRRT